MWLFLCVCMNVACFVCLGMNVPIFVCVGMNVPFFVCVLVFVCVHESASLCVFMKLSVCACKWLRVRVNATVFVCTNSRTADVCACRTHILLLFTLLFVSAICQMQDRVSGGESSSRRVGKALSRTPTEEGSILQLIFINRRERRGNSTFSNQSLGIPPPFRHAGGGTTRQLLRLLLLERTSASSRVALPLRPSLVLLLIPAGQRNQSGAALD